MRAKPFISLVIASCALVLSFATSTKDKPDTQPKGEYQLQEMTYEERQQLQHQQTCNILGHASNIFGNFVQLVSRPNDQANIGAQVGNMAQNIFHIVAEAASNKALSKSEQDILKYLNSTKFRQDLEKEILKQLENL